MTRSQATSVLSETDRGILHLLTEHRVATTEQVRRSLDLPERTVRYRLDRLRSFGLAGAARPYAERGSAPHHWYPTRAADAFARGAPVPRGGDRDAPNEAFLRHGAAVTGLYVALCRSGPSLGLQVVSAVREAAATEEFDAGGARTAIVPDLTVVLAHGEATVRAFFEVDLGTMSMPRLARKLACYAAYAREEAWKARHPFLPPLLVLTTTARRAEAVVATWERVVAKTGPRGWAWQGQEPTEELAIGASDVVLSPEVAISEPVWLAPGGRDGLRLLDVLEPPHRAWVEREAARRAEDAGVLARLRELRSSPEARRAALRAASTLRDFWPVVEDLGDDEVQKAMSLLLEADEPMAAIERRSFSFFDRRVVLVRHADRVLVFPSRESPEVADGEREAARRLHAFYLDLHRRLVASLHRRHPGCPVLVGAIRDLEQGRLLDPFELAHLRERVGSNLEELGLLGEKIGRYLSWREAEVARVRSEAGALARLRFTRDQAAREIDARHVAVCRDCRQLCVLMPEDPGWARPACLLCRRDGLPLHEALARGLVESDGRGFWRVVSPALPGWVESMAQWTPDIDGEADQEGKGP